MMHAALVALALSAAPLSGHAADSVRSDREIRETVLRNAADVRRCYELHGLRQDPDLAGAIEIALTVLPTGAVDSVEVERVALQGRGTREVTACIVAVARHWRFERGPFETETIVLPFNLRPEDPYRVTSGS
jgi:hypothetical protein